ncbi:hypothetical protein BU16DRAFT_590208 [Lophium mytilinum]|uniref:Uncharacterized protein n=1 Tax=Lophium mytilinum TaxID=390894 RepID=A0A6A6QS37_9PEZI|nr:hypothetical protein BU16DRAFT_590208 [Lophium mytilinum]
MSPSSHVVTRARSKISLNRTSPHLAHHQETPTQPPLHDRSSRNASRLVNMVTTRSQNPRPPPDTPTSDMAPEIVSGMMRLPTELRRQIIKEIIPRNDTFRIAVSYDKDGLFHCTLPELERHERKRTNLRNVLGLRLINHTLYDEFTEEFFGANNFTFKLLPSRKWKYSAPNFEANNTWISSCVAQSLKTCDLNVLEMDWETSRFKDEKSFNGTRNWFAKFAAAMGTGHRLKKLYIDCNWARGLNTGPNGECWTETIDVPFFLEPVASLYGINAVGIRFSHHDEFYGGSGGVPSGFAAQLQDILMGTSKSQIRLARYGENVMVKQPTGDGAAVLSSKISKRYWEPEFEWTEDEEVRAGMQRYARKLAQWAAEDRYREQRLKRKRGV